MDFTETSEHGALRSTIRAFLAAHMPEEAVRDAASTMAGFDPTTWRIVADELQLCSLAVPEEFGGAGYSFAEVCIALEEFGNSLACLPYFSSTVLATSLLLHPAADPPGSEWLPQLAGGSLRATVAWIDDAPPTTTDPAAVATARLSERGWRLDGVKTFVLDGSTADLVIVTAHTPRGLSLFTVDGKAESLAREPLSTMDATRKQSRIRLRNTPGTLVGSEGDATDALRWMLNVASVGLAAEQVGGTQRCLDMSVSYAKNRHQFGRPIGAFQSIQHLCADMLIRTECARSAMLHGVLTATENVDDLPISASLAKSFCSDAFVFAAESNIQVHGAIGFTWEHPAHLYYKRAKSSQIMLGTPQQHRERLAEKIGVTARPGPVRQRGSFEGAL